MRNRNKRNIFKKFFCLFTLRSRSKFVININTCKSGMRNHLPTKTSGTKPKTLDFVNQRFVFLS